MTLFSAPNDPWSHRTRIVLAEKGISIDIVSVEPGKFPEDLLDLNPYHSVPTLVDRDLVLYDSRVIIEYLDERFPHPPLMPVDPVTRAQFRLALYRIERDWYSLVQQIEQEPDKCWLYFCLGMIDHRYKGDLLSARRDFQKFLDRADLARFPRQVAATKRWIQEIDNTLSGAEPTEIV